LVYTFTFWYAVPRKIWQPWFGARTALISMIERFNSRKPGFWMEKSDFLFHSLRFHLLSNTIFPTI
jgi:hypothetical protein